jgi:hypothetical protein
MFRGTVSQTSVYPREVVRDALLRNSSALLLVHNHPSGATNPSRADEYLTQTLKQASFTSSARGRMKPQFFPIRNFGYHQKYHHPFQSCFRSF